MAKKKKYQNPKSAKKPNLNNSNALLPARAPGEEPELPYVMPPIKTENTEESLNLGETENMEERLNLGETEDMEERLNLGDLLSLIHEAKINAGNTSENISSVASATAEPMETDESIHCQNYSEVNEPLASCGQMRVKQEPMEADIQSESYVVNPGVVEESGAQAFIPGHNSSTTSSTSMDFSSDLNGCCIKKEPSENDEPNDVNCDQTVSVKKETIETNENQTDLENESINQATKRKIFEEKFEVIRKRLKTEKDDDDNNEKVVALSQNETQASCVAENGKQNVDHNESIQNMHTDEIAILPVPKVEQNVPVIIDLCLSDEEEENQNSDIDLISNADGNRNSSSILTTNSLTPSPEKKKKRNFSTDILKYFNVVSELDRNDCETALEYLTSKYETKSILYKFFPVIKKGGKSTPREIKKGDILFQNLTRTDSESDSASYPESRGFNLSDRVVFQPAAEPNLSYNSFCSTHTAETGSLFTTFPVASAAPPAPSYADLSPASLSVPLQPQLSNLNQLASFAVNFEKLQAIMQSVHTTTSVNGNTQAPPVIDNCNPKPTLNLPSSRSESNIIPIIPSTAPMIPQAPAVPSSRLPISSHQFRTNFPPSATPSLSVNRDPRIAAKANFAIRKGTKDLQLYENIGKDDITAHFDKIVLQWNPSWLNTQLNSSHYPPICSSYPTVGYFYPNEMAYYNTYVPLHLLHVWHEIFECWVQKRGVTINCKCQSVEKADDVFIISCSTELDERKVWPKRDDIVLCQYNQEEAFLRVEEVKKRPTDLETRKKLKISLETLHDLKLHEGEDFKFYILFNIRIACLETKALKSLDNNMKELVLKPENYRDNIKIIKLVQKGIKDQRNEIMAVVELNHSRVILVEICHMCDVNLLLTQLAYHIAYGQKPKDPNQPPPRSFRSKVLICMKSQESLCKILKRLADYKPVLAVRTKQLSLSEDAVKHSIEYRLDKGETLNDILNSTHIFLTTFSSFGTAEKNHLSKVSKLTCIVDDAHLCCEVETTLLLTLKLTKLLLMGNLWVCPVLPRILMNQRYHISFFVRLLKIRQLR